MLDMNYYEQLAKSQITYITIDTTANNYLRTIKAPNCKDIFMTVIDGTQHLYVPLSIPNECVPV